MRRLRLLALAVLCASSCAGDSGQPVPTAPSSASDPRSSAGLSSPGRLDDFETAAESESVDTEFHEIGPAAATFTLSGKVTDKAVFSWAIANATVTITPGIPARKTSSLGFYTVKLSARTYTRPLCS